MEKALFRCHHLPILTNGELVLLKRKGDGVCFSELSLSQHQRQKTRQLCSVQAAIWPAFPQSPAHTTLQAESEGWRALWGYS